jgi:iron complex outermembrane receptor protein
MKLVPGVYAESTGGQSGANIEVRGFPSGSDSPFVSVQLNGNPIYPVPVLSFFEGSSAFRLDDTVERVEVLRGGPSTIYSVGQPGATMNFILKKGTDTPEGTVRLTTGTGSLRRVDMYYGGKISDGWYGRSAASTARPMACATPQFPADDGGQLTATLTRKLDQGELTLYVRSHRRQECLLHRRAADLQQQRPHHQRLPRLRSADRHPDEQRNAPLHHRSGARQDPQARPGRWPRHEGHRVRRQLRPEDRRLGAYRTRQLFHGDLNTISMFTGNNPLTMRTSMPTWPTPTGFNRGAAAGHLGQHDLCARRRGRSGNQQVVQAGLWSVEKQLKSFTDELRVSKELGKDNTITVGGYYANYKSDDVWYLGNSHLMTATPNASLINVTLNNGVIVSKNGTDGNVNLRAGRRLQGQQHRHVPGRRVEGQRSHQGRRRHAPSTSA